ncbi:MAG: SPOR domain-containing protein, partial [Candidatus Margulisbacteria bacterium]|nr:SPOR domain-containing protein [Candidatus Margulisiibacteriota bacterium]
MLDEYKEDFGTGIDDLEFDNVPENYPQPNSYTSQKPQPQAQQDYYAPPLPPQRENYYAPSRPRIPAFQNVAPAVDPVHYEQPRYVGYSDAQGPSIGEILRSKEPRLGCLRTLILGGISLIIIAFSFWGSFMLGQKIFMPPLKEQFMQSKKDQIPDFLNPSTRKTVPFNLPPEEIIPQKSEKIYVKSTGLKPTTTTPVKKYVPKIIFRVIAGTFNSKQNAQLTLQQLKDDGFETLIKQTGGKYQIQIGAFSNKNS